jgi:hypothetical protein
VDPANPAFPGIAADGRVGRPTGSLSRPPLNACIVMRIENVMAHCKTGTFVRADAVRVTCPNVAQTAALRARPPWYPAALRKSLDCRIEWVSMATPRTADVVYWRDLPVRSRTLRWRWLCLTLV